MLRLQLWNGTRLLHETFAPSTVEAERRIDQLLTELHARKYGAGKFALEADYVDERRNNVFLGSMWRDATIQVQPTVSA